MYATAFDPLTLNVQLLSHYLMDDQSLDIV